MEIILCIGDPSTGKTYRKDLSKEESMALLGKKIGEIIPGDAIGLPGYKLKITGGRDKDGFPMHPGVHGTGRRRVLLSGPPGFRPRRKGERRAKLVRGNVIWDDIRQVNLKVVEWGPEPLEKLLAGGEKKGE